jgi:hypothetical protein
MYCEPNLLITEHEFNAMSRQKFLEFQLMVWTLKMLLLFRTVNLRQW